MSKEKSSSLMKSGGRYHDKSLMPLVGGLMIFLLGVWLWVPWQETQLKMAWAVPIAAMLGYVGGLVQGKWRYQQ